MLLAIPVVLTVAVPDWMYSNPSVIDAWVYNGFFRHLEAYATAMFPDTYYGARLAWILPGYVAYHAFEPHVAAFALHVTFYVLATGSMYGIVRHIAGASEALFVTLAFGWYVPAVQALGSDYVDGAVITYALVATWLALDGAGENRWWRTIASGTAAGAMLHSNVGAAFLVPSILVWFVPERRDVAWKQVALRVALWAGGIVLCTAVLAIVSAGIGAEWDFFLDSFRWMHRQGWTSNPFQPPEASLVSSAPWVFLPAGTAIGAIVVLLSPGRRRRLNAAQIRALAAFASACALFAGWDYVGPGAVLYWPFYSSWLLPWSFIVIGAVLVPPALDTRGDIAAASVSACGMLASVVWAKQVALPVPGAAGLAAVGGLFALVALARSAVLGRLLVGLAVVCLHGWLAGTTWYSRVDDREDAFRAIDEGVRAIERYVTTEEPRFLLTSEGPLGHYIQGLTSVYLWGYTIASHDFLRITPQEAARIRPGRVVIVIDERPDTAARFDDVFAPYRLRARVLGTARIETRHGPLHLTFLQPIRDAARHGDRGAGSAILVSPHEIYRRYAAWEARSFDRGSRVPVE